MQNPFEWQIPFELQGVSIPVQSCLSTICEFVIVIKNVVRRRPKNRFRFRFLNIIILFYKFELKLKITNLMGWNSSKPGTEVIATQLKKGEFLIEVEYSGTWGFKQQVDNIANQVEIDFPGT